MGVTGMDWADLRIFLALARRGSVRAAGVTLGMSHSTIARRIDTFEARLGVRLFDRQSSGYAMTAAGEELMTTAARVEEDISDAERRLVGKDGKLRGEIKVTMSDGGPGEVMVEFRDTGEGIPGEHHDRVFLPFFTTKDYGKGTGLGLSIVARIVHEHGGRIELESKPGQGTTFHLWFPRARKTAGGMSGVLSDPLPDNHGDGPGSTTGIESR